MFFQFLVAGIHSAAFAFWVVPWINEFGLLRRAAMLIITVSILVAGATAPLLGAVLDRARTGLWMWFAGAVAVFSAGLALISFAPSYPVLILIYGIVLPPSTIICGQLGSQVLITRWFAADRGFALGMSALGTSLGAFIMPTLATVLLAAFGWRATFQMLAFATAIILVPLSWLVLRRRPPAHPQSEPVLDQAWTTAMLLANRDFRIITLCFTAFLIAYLPPYFSVGTYAQDLGIPQKTAAMLASASAVALATGKVAFGKLADVRDQRMLFVLAATLLVVGIGAISAARTVETLALGLFLAAFANGCYLPLAAAMLADRFGTRSFGRVLGLMTIFVQCGALAPFVSGAIRDISGTYRIAYLIMLLPLFGALLAIRSLSVTVPNRRRHQI